MKIVVNALKALLVIVVVVNTLAAYLLFQNFTSLRAEVVSKSPETPSPTKVGQMPTGEKIDMSTYATKEYVDESIASIPKDTVKTETVTVTVPSTTKQTTIIPISAEFSTQSTDWIEVVNSDFYLDLVGDYGEEATANWDAFIHEQHGNGKVYARLFDVTHSIAVVGSDLENNSETSKLETSAGILGIWRGKNLYRVQIKSQIGFPVFFNSGRLKITY